MKRLTTTIVNFSTEGTFRTLSKEGHMELKQYSDVSLGELYCRLQTYEDTGLTPEQIVKMQADNAKMRELLKMAVEDIRKILADEYSSECQFCRLSRNEYALCHKSSVLDCWCCDNAKWQHADEVEEVLKSGE